MGAGGCCQLSPQLPHTLEQLSPTQRCLKEPLLYSHRVFILDISANPSPVRSTAKDFGSERHGMRKARRNKGAGPASSGGRKKTAQGGGRAHPHHPTSGSGAGVQEKSPGTGSSSVEVLKRRCDIWGHGLVVWEGSGSMVSGGFSHLRGSPGLRAGMCSCAAQPVSPPESNKCPFLQPERLPANPELGSPSQEKKKRFSRWFFALTTIGHLGFRSQTPLPVPPPPCPACHA